MKMHLDNDIAEIIENITDLIPQIRSKRVLFTGANGFLGRYFIELMYELNTKHTCEIEVVGIDNNVTSLYTEDPKYLSSKIRIIQGDATIVSKLGESFDYIFHLAGIASPAHYKAKPLETIDVAVNATRECLERAKTDGAKVLYFSSSEIYGDPTPDMVPTKESYRGNVSTRGPRACYDESKRLGETLCWVYETYFNVWVTVVRPFNVYGPGMLPKDYRVLPNFAYQIKNATPITIYGDGKQTRTFCYVTDAITGFMRLILSNNKPDVYNVGNPNPEVSINELAELIARILGKQLNISHTDYPNSYPPDEPMRRCPDISKIQQAVHYIPKVDLEEGLSRFLKWADEVYEKAE